MEFWIKCYKVLSPHTYQTIQMTNSPKNGGLHIKDLLTQSSVDLKALGAILDFDNIFGSSEQNDNVIPLILVSNPNPKTKP